MALTFNGTTSYLEFAGSFPLPAKVFMFAWFKPANTSQTAAVVSCGRWGFGEEVSLLQIGAVIRAQTRDGVNSANSAVGDLNASAWQSVAGRFNFSLLGSNAYINAGTSSGSAVLVNYASFDRVVVGRRGFDTSLPCAGDIAEIAIWDITSAELSAQDLLDLQAGALPETIAPAQLIDAWSLVSQSATHTGVNGTVLTAYDATEAASHPISRSTGSAVSFYGNVPLQSAVQGAAFSFDLSTYFSGTETPFAYSVQTGVLPSGLSLNTATGVISGTPTSVETMSGIVVRATDQNSDTADTNAFQVAVEEAPTNPAFELVANGTQTLYSQPLSAFAGGKTFVGWVNASGDVGVTAYDHASGTATSFTLSSAFEANAHNNGTVLVRQDGRLVCCWSKHNESPGTVHYRVSTSPLDISAWGAEQTFSVSTDNTYNLQAYLSTPNRYYVCFRAAAAGSRVRSTQDWVTWDTERTWVQNGTERPYVVWRSNGIDRIDVFFSSGHPNEVVSSLYHAYVLVDAVGAEIWYKSDGTLIGAGPVTPGNATLVYEGSTYDGWNSDILVGRDGFPRVLFQQYRDVGVDHRHMYSRLTDAGWTTPVEVCAAGGYLYATQVWSDGQACFDAQNPDVVYASVTVAGKKRLQEWRTDDHGASWRFVRTLNTDTDHSDFTPSSPEGHDGRAAVVWNYGSYINYDNINYCSIRAAESKRVERTLRDRAGTLAANLSGLQYLVLDEPMPSDVSSVLASGSDGATDAEGVFRAAAVGAAGASVLLIISDTSGDPGVETRGHVAPTPVT